jgi:hypothetical protein
MLFSSSSLCVSGFNKQEGRINYLIKFCEDEDNENTRNIEKEFKSIVNEIKLISIKNEYICRVYIYNCTALTPENSTTENAFIWIKRYDTDEEFKDDKTTFNVLTGEVNKVYSLNVLWPYTFDIKIQVFGISGFMHTQSLIGETSIDLERRLFNKVYLDKISE